MNSTDQETLIQPPCPRAGSPPSKENPRHPYAAVHDELMLDGNARQNLATFCQIWEEPEIHQLMDERINKDMVDRDDYPQTVEIEARCICMLSDLWSSPAGANGRAIHAIFFAGSIPLTIAAYPSCFSPASFAFVLPIAMNVNLAPISLTFMLIGAAGLLVGSLLMLPETLASRRIPSAILQPQSRSNEQSPALPLQHQLTGSAAETVVS